jgi:hypothetical protein
MMQKRFTLFALCLMVLWLANVLPANSQAKQPSFFQLKVYHLKDQAQEAQLDKYLQQAYLPAMHRAGITKVGVFKHSGEAVDAKNPAPTEQAVFVFIPFKSYDEFFKLDQKLAKDKQYTAAAKEYIDAAHNGAPYDRIESTLMEAFAGMTNFSVPKLKSDASERIYELRSYESATEKLHLNKVDMFNKGEIELFERLGFNAVFYGRVVAGCRMPNLVYMTTFENRAERDAHWEAFRVDPAWKKMSSLPEYANNVSRNVTYLLRPTSYSDI